MNHKDKNRITNIAKNNEIAIISYSFFLINFATIYDQEQLFDLISDSEQTMTMHIFGLIFLKIDLEDQFYSESMIKDPPSTNFFKKSKISKQPYFGFIVCLEVQYVIKTCSDHFLTNENLKFQRNWDFFIIFRQKVQFSKAILRVLESRETP